jgi:hypothetical protein
MDNPEALERRVQYRLTRKQKLPTTSTSPVTRNSGIDAPAARINEIPSVILDSVGINNQRVLNSGGRRGGFTNWLTRTKNRFQWRDR